MKARPQPVVHKALWGRALTAAGLGTLRINLLVDINIKNNLVCIVSMLIRSFSAPPFLGFLFK